MKERHRPYLQTKDPSKDLYRCLGYSYKKGKCQECAHGELHKFDVNCNPRVDSKECRRFKCKKFHGDPDQIWWTKACKQASLREELMKDAELPHVRRVIRVQGRIPMTRDYLTRKQFDDTIKNIEEKVKTTPEGEIVALSIVKAEPVTFLSFIVEGTIPQEQLEIFRELWREQTKSGKAIPFSTKGYRHG